MKSKLTIFAVVVLLLATVATAAFAGYNSHLTDGVFWVQYYSNKLQLYWGFDYDTEPPDPPFDGYGYMLTNYWDEIVCQYLGTENSTCQGDIGDAGTCDFVFDENGFPFKGGCSFPDCSDFERNGTCHIHLWYEGPSDWDGLDYYIDDCPCP